MYSKRSRNLINNLPDALIEVDLATRQITYMNRFVYDLFGYEEKNITIKREDTLSE